jgi:hypothetical protein
MDHLKVPVAIEQSKLIPRGDPLRKTRRVEQRESILAQIERMDWLLGGLAVAVFDQEMNVPREGHAAVPCESVLLRNIRAHFTEPDFSN